MQRVVGMEAGGFEGTREMQGHVWWDVRWMGGCSGNGGLRCEGTEGDAAACAPLALIKYTAWHNVCVLS